MQGRVRGHYRIDENGRVEPLVDVNRVALERAAIPPTLPRRRRAGAGRSSRNRITHFAVAGLLISALGAASTGALPYIHRAIENAQFARVDAARAEIRKAHALRAAHRLGK